MPLRREVFKLIKMASILRKSILIWVILFVSCNRAPEERKKVSIETDFSEAIVERLKPYFLNQFENLDITWKTTKTQKLNDQTEADLVIFSDGFWFQKNKSQLIPYRSKHSNTIFRPYRDTEEAFIAVAIEAVNIGYNTELLKPEQVPEKWENLRDPRWKRKVQVANPDQTPPVWYALATLGKAYGLSFLDQLSKNQLSFKAEKKMPIYIDTFKNFLKLRETPSPIRMIYPLDGIIPTPVWMGIYNKHQDPATLSAIQSVYDEFIGSQVQSFLVKQLYFSPVSGSVTLMHTRPWKELKRQVVAEMPGSLPLLFEMRNELGSKIKEMVAR